MESKNKVFSSTEVSLHDNDKDCWVVINAKVYDVTSFLNDHPGGNTVLLAAAGKNASEEFEEAGHGSAARLMLDEYYVGEIDGTPEISKTTSSRLEIHPKQTSTKEQTGKKEDDMQPDFSMVKALGFTAALAILALAIGFALNE